MNSSGSRRTKRAARAFFFGSFPKKKRKKKKDQTPVRGPPAQPSLFRFVREARRTFSTQKNQQQPQRTFSNRALRWPISAATLTIDVARERRERKRRTSTRVPSYSIVSRSRAKKKEDF